MDQALVGLSDAVEALRSELTEAIGRGANQPMRFRLDPIELTVQAVVTKGASGDIGWKLIAKAGGSYDVERTQTLTLRLTPEWHAANGEVTQNPAIAATSAAGDRFGPQR